MEFRGNISFTKQQQIHEHSFRVLGQRHRLFCDLTPFPGEMGGGGVLSAFSKEKFRFTVFFVMPPVYKRCKRNSLKHNHVKNG